MHFAFAKLAEFVCFSRDCRESFLKRYTSPSPCISITSFKKPSTSAGRQGTSEQVQRLGLVSVCGDIPLWVLDGSLHVSIPRLFHPGRGFDRWTSWYALIWVSWAHFLTARVDETSCCDRGYYLYLLIMARSPVYWVCNFHFHQIPPSFHLHHDHHSVDDFSNFLSVSYLSHFICSLT